MNNRRQPWGQDGDIAIAALATTDALPIRFVLHKFGQNETLAPGDWIGEPGGAYPYLTYTGTPLAMRVAAGGNIADTADGAGARTVTISGLDGDFALVSDTVTLAGVSASAATTTTFSRVTRAFVETTGTGRVNTAAVTIEDSTGANSYAVLPAGKGQSLLATISVPRSFRVWISHIFASTSVIAATATVAVAGYKRGGIDQTEAPFDSKRLFWNNPALSRENGFAYINFEEPIGVDELTDVWFEATSTTGTPIVDVSFTAMFEKK